MIDHKEPLSMFEAVEYAKNKEVKSFAKNFSKVKDVKLKELKEKLQELDMIKLNPKHISKILEFLPEDKEDLNKILVDVNLDENETTKLLETIKGIN